MAVSKAQIRANKKWKEKNRGYNAYINNRSAAKGFIANQSTKKDIEELRDIMEKREKYLDKLDNIKKKTNKIFNDYAKNLVIDSKSNLIRDLKYQRLYEDFKSIKGDPLIGIWNNQKLRSLADLSNGYDKYPKMIQELKNGKFEKVIGYYYDYEGTKFYEDYTPIIKKDTKQEQDKLSSDIAEKQARYDGETEFSRSDFLNLLSKTIEPAEEKL